MLVSSSAPVLILNDIDMPEINGVPQEAMDVENQGDFVQGVIPPIKLEERDSDYFD